MRLRHQKEDDPGSSQPGATAAPPTSGRPPRRRTATNAAPRREQREQEAPGQQPPSPQETCTSGPASSTLDPGAGAAGARLPAHRAPQRRKSRFSLQQRSTYAGEIAQLEQRREELMRRVEALSREWRDRSARARAATAAAGHYLALFDLGAALQRQDQQGQRQRHAFDWGRQQREMLQQLHVAACSLPLGQGAAGGGGLGWSSAAAAARAAAADLSVGGLRQVLREYILEAGHLYM
jgi:hypothetical protein